MNLQGRVGRDRRLAFTLFTALALVSGAAHGTPSPEQPSGYANPANENVTEEGSEAAGDTHIPHEDFASRHFRVLHLDVIARDLYSDNAPHIVTDRETQYKVSMVTLLNLDAHGNTSLGTRGETGNSFGNSWNNTGQGLGTAQTNFEVKALFLRQKFERRFEFQVGGIEFDQGVGSQATYAAGEAYLTGYRLRIATPDAGWMPEAISLTGGQVSDFNSANVFSRLHRLGDLNYAQLLAQKKLGARDQASLEADSIAGISYLRSAVRVDNLHHVFFDDILIEAIGRVSEGADGAWSVRAGKDWDRGKRWRSEAIYVSMPSPVFASPTGPVLQNWGEFGLGQRIGASSAYHVTRDFSLSFLGSRRTDNTPDTYRWRGFVAAQYDFAPLAGQALRHMK